MTEKEQDWFFTWGFGQEYPGCYTKIHGTFASAREEMVRRHGLGWAFQYESADKAGVHKFNLTEIRGKPHDFFTNKDFLDDTDLEGYLAQIVVEGGLSICRVCGLIEGSLTTHCPGGESHAEYGDRIYKGEIDFICGQWVEGCSKHTPAFYRKAEK